MKTGLMTIVILLVVLAAQAGAAVPPMMSYQGKLMQPNGTPVPDGDYSIRFAIYDAPTAGNTLWSETNPNVQVKGGLFATMLGSIVNLPANVFDSPSRFFGIKVGSDSELIPRQQIASSAFAFRSAIAGTVDDGAITASKLASGAVTAEKISDGGVTTMKLAVGIATPPGSISMFGGSAAPTGWLLCDGAAISRTTYADLFAAIGTSYGSGDGTTTFNLPDLRQKFALGKAVSGTGSALGEVGGIIDHKHKGYGSAGGDLRATIGACDNDAAQIGYIALSAIDPNTGHGFGTPTYSVRGTGFSNNAGFNHYTPVIGFTGAENPPYVVVNYIIKY